METDTNFKPDKWQQKILEHQGDICARTGRQVGKSEIISKKVASFALEHDNAVILVMAPSKRQSAHIFEKTMRELQKVSDVMLEKAGGFGVDLEKSARSNEIARREFERQNGLFEGMPTKTEVNLKNGTRIYCLPIGKTGTYIRCLTIDLLVGEEAAYIPECVWTAVKPMLAVSKKTRGLGWEFLLSTPFGKGGYFYNASMDEDYLQIHVSSEDCPRISRDFLKKERARLTKSEYAQEYLGQFIDDWNQFFKTDLLQQRMTFIGWNYAKEYDTSRSYYMGMDIAKYGGDESAIVILEMDSKNHCRIVRCDAKENMKITETARWAQALDQLWHFKAVFVDNQGLGEGVLDLLKEALGKSRVVGLNNSSKSIQDGNDGEDRRRRILKEDLYSNALKMLEAGEVELIADLKLLKSLKGMQFEYTNDQNLRIFGKYSHLSEAFVRACWAKKQKKLRLFIY